MASRTVARITRPQAAAVVGTDAHLPGVSPDRLSEAALRRRFALGLHDWQPELAGDGRLQDLPTREASVLVPLVKGEQGLQVLLAQRTHHLHDHAGQISFPGGRRDPQDLDEVHTALREAQEEIGLPAGHVEVIGALPAYTTVTHYRVTPVVGLVRADFDLALDAFEVAEAFEVPLAFLMNPAHHQRHVVELDGTKRQFLSMPWRQGGREYFIWGATAAMLRNLYAFLSHR